MIRINQMKLNIEHPSDDFERKILKTLCIKKEELQGFQIRKQSIDARKKPVLYSEPGAGACAAGLGTELLHAVRRALAHDAV